MQLGSTSTGQQRFDPDPRQSSQLAGKGSYQVCIPFKNEGDYTGGTIPEWDALPPQDYFGMFRNDRIYPVNIPFLTYQDNDGSDALFHETKILLYEFTNGFGHGG